MPDGAVARLACRHRSGDHIVLDDESRVQTQAFLLTCSCSLSFPFFHSEKSPLDGSTFFSCKPTSQSATTDHNLSALFPSCLKSNQLYTFRLKFWPPSQHRTRHVNTDFSVSLSLRGMHAKACARAPVKVLEASNSTGDIFFL